MTTSFRLNLVGSLGSNVEIILAIKEKFVGSKLKSLYPRVRSLQKCFQGGMRLQWGVAACKESMRALASDGGTRSRRSVSLGRKLVC
jgi:hypothetical protein